MNQVLPAEVHLRRLVSLLRDESPLAICNAMFPLILRVLAERGNPDPEPEEMVAFVEDLCRCHPGDVQGIHGCVGGSGEPRQGTSETVPKPRSCIRGPREVIQVGLSPESY